MIDRFTRKLASLIPGRSAAGTVQPFLRKVNALDTAIGFTISNNIVGDYFEFGVFRGKSFIHAYHYYHAMVSRYREGNPAFATLPFFRHRPRFFAFDSFEGLPPTADALPAHWTGERAMSCDRTTFAHNLEQGGLPLDVVVMVEGYYDVSLTPDLATRHRMDKAAVIHIDCDLYESTVTVLDFVVPFLTDGTVFVFDDYFYYQGHPKRGERGAFNAWLEKHPELVSSELCKFSPAAAYIVNFV